MNIILASSSVHRKKQLEQIGLSFSCVSPDIDETNVLELPPKQLALDLAIKKGKAITDNHQSLIDRQSLIISGDQTACIENRMLGKPGSKEAAIEQLAFCSGKCAIFYSAISVLNSHTTQMLSEVVETHVQFRDLSKTQIIAYVEKDNPISCAGSFKSESLGIGLFEKVSSDDPSALVGLPLITLTRMLYAQGEDVLIT